MWWLLAVAAFLGLVHIGRQVRNGKWQSGPWFKQFRAFRSAAAWLVMMAGVLCIGFQRYPYGIALFVVAALISASVRFQLPNRHAQPETAAAYSPEEIQAYRILGLSIGAGRKAVLEAWKRLMKEAHPDQGGSTERATALNAARDLLLKRRR